jgi:hypothetical protein
MNTVAKQALDLVYQIEKFPASPLQTETVIMASALREKIEETYGYIICCFCGHKTKVVDNFDITKTEMAKHMLGCDKHPLTLMLNSYLDRLDRANQSAADVTESNKQAIIYNEVQSMLSELGYAVNTKGIIKERE